MISGATPPNCFPTLPQANLHMYPQVVADHHQDQDVSSTVDHHHHHHRASNSSSDHSHSNSLLYSLSLLKEKVHQVQSMVSILIAPDQTLAAESTASMAVANMGTLIQEIIVTASSMMFTCQQMASSAAVATTTTTHHNDIIHHSTTTNSSPDHLQLHQVPRVKAQDDTVLSQDVTNFDVTSNRGIGQQHRGQIYFSTETSMYHDWYNSDNYNNSNITSSNSRVLVETSGGKGGEGTFPSPKNDDKSIYDNIIELDASDLLAKYTHYCQVCGKGFKRDANLRMHMRAHGDEYKTSAALSNPLKNNSDTTTNGGGAGGGDHKDINSNNNSTKSGRKYSCPQEGCRWNRKHVKFQPLKSMVCVKNHYKRSHCPKMYVCKRCNTKQFSVLSDLRTHEKHCGDVKWQCSCGTTFSRKDKLMGHVALFVGHSPAITSTTGSTSSLTKLQGKVENQ